MVITDGHFDSPTVACVGTDDYTSTDHIANGVSTLIEV